MLVEPEIYLIDLTVDPAPFAKLLSSEEQARVARFRLERHRAWWTVARGRLRQILGDCLGAQPDAIEFETEEYGKPFVKGADLRFNLSHSHEWGLLGVVEGREIGVDIEFHKAVRDFEGIARRFFSESEVAALFALPETDWLAGFYRCWTRKEAFIKAIGTGLYLPLDQFSVEFRPSLKPEILSVSVSGFEAEEWALFDLDVPVNYSGALVIRR